MPLLVRGLRQDNTTAIKRKAALIIENMAKLVDNPLDAVPFLPKLLPGAPDCWAQRLVVGGPTPGLLPACMSVCQLPSPPLR